MTGGRQLVPLLLIGVGLITYHNSFSGPFIFDDLPPIKDNSHIRHLWPIWEALSTPARSSLSGRPFVSLSLAINYAISGFNVWSYHLFNLSIHLLATLTLFGVIRRTLLTPRLQGKYGEQASAIALAVALIWMVHPLLSDGINYIINRTELLMGLFFLLTLYCVIQGSREHRRKFWYGGALIACGLGMCSKEVMALAPITVMLYDRIFLSVSWREMLRTRWVLYVGLISSWLLLIPLVFKGQATVGAAGFHFEDLTPWDYLRTQCGVILHYLQLCVWPHPLSLDYDGWPVAKSWGAILPATLVVFATIGATVWALRYRPCMGFLGAWFFLILAPTSSFLPIRTEIAAERRMYLPLAAVVTLMVLVGHRLLDILFPRRWQWLKIAFVSGVVVVLAFVTIRRNEDYRSELRIWQDTVQKRPNNPRAHYNLGIVLAAQGKTEEAFAHYSEALQLNPYYADAHNNLGMILSGQGKNDEAIAHYVEAIRINPDKERIHYNLAIALDSKGNREDAIAHYSEAVRINPEFVEAHNNLGMALAAQGKTADAIVQYVEALRVKPDHVRARYNLAIALASQGKLDEAIQHYLEVVRLSPNYAEAHNNLGLLLATQGRFDDAMVHYNEALRIKPGNVRTRFNLGLALSAQRKSDVAMQQFTEALRLARTTGQTSLVSIIEKRMEVERANEGGLPVHESSGQ